MKDLEYRKATKLREEIFKIRQQMKDIKSFLHVMNENRVAFNQKYDDPDFILLIKSKKSKELNIGFSRFNDIKKVLQDLYNDKDKKANKLIKEFNEL